MKKVSLNKFKIIIRAKQQEKSATLQIENKFMFYY